MAKEDEAHEALRLCELSGHCTQTSKPPWSVCGHVWDTRMGGA